MNEVGMPIQNTMGHINNNVILMIIMIVVVIIAIMVIRRLMKSPFHYPYFRLEFDVSGKRQPSIMDYIDEYLINGGLETINEHYNRIRKWKKRCKKVVKKSGILREYRQSQFKATIDDKTAFRFSIYRMQTRYRQYNYQRSPYKVAVVVDNYSCDYNFLVLRDKKLQEIEYACPLSAYSKKNQRKLMTKKLIEQIAERDCYTCQICGQYMPDGIGLQIDHIVSVSKGGKSIPSNLQVLCSKCNGRKANRLKR